MTKCQGCGTEILSQDRFCKNCGAPAAASVEDLEDTRRFDPTARATTTGTLDQNKAVYLAGAPTYPLPAESGSLRPAQSYIKSLIHRKAFWLLTFLLLFVFIGTGVTVGRDVIRARRAQHAEDARAAARAAQVRQRRLAEAAQKTSGEAIQNAMGFVPGEIVSAEYPDIKGVFVTSLTGDDSPAAVASLQAGDVLIGFADQPVADGTELARALTGTKPGTEVQLKLLRDDEPVSTRITLGSLAIVPFQAKTAPRDQGYLGVGDVARRCCVSGKRRWGLEIHRIVDNSPADLAGLQLRDVITEFNKQVVRTPGELARLIHAAKPRSKVQIKLVRGTTEQTLELTLGHGW